MKTETTSLTDQDAFAQVAAAMDRAHALARAYVTTLPGRPVAARSTPAGLAAALDEPLPEEPSDPAEAVAEWLRRAEPGIVASAGPRFFGYVVGGSTPAAVAGDWLATALDQCSGFYPASPAAAETELVVVRWLQDLFGLPASWSGTLTGGATMSNLTGLAAGRQWVGQKLGFDPAAEGLGGQPVIPVITNAMTHSSARKALSTLGLGRMSLHEATAIDGRVDIDDLARKLAAIDGPAIIMATVGEVNSGHSDDISAIADLRDAHPGGAWLHVDGAFGLFAGISPALRHLVAGVERADSVASDLHKWLNVPYGGGVAFVRDAALHTSAFAIPAPYTANSEGWNSYDYGPEMSRRFRALAAWCALKAFGRAGYRAMVERCVSNARQFADWIATQPDIELLTEQELNIVCFRFSQGAEDLDAFNRQAVTAIQRDGRAFVSGTAWNGHAAIRAAFDHWATTPEDVQILCEAVRSVQ